MKNAIIVAILLLGIFVSVTACGLNAWSQRDTDFLNEVKKEDKSVAAIKPASREAFRILSYGRRACFSFGAGSSEDKVEESLAAAPADAQAIIKAAKLELC